jgi:hypothetical protein
MPVIDSNQKRTTSLAGLLLSHGFRGSVDSAGRREKRRELVSMRKRERDPSSKTPAFLAGLSARKEREFVTGKSSANLN